MFAVSFNGAVSPLAVGSWNRGSVNDQIVADPCRIASVARRDEILQRVVLPVAVDMIDDEIGWTRLTFPANDPRDLFAAPVAWMSTGPNGIVKKYPVNEHSPSLRGDGVIGQHDSTGVKISIAGDAALECVPAFSGAVHRRSASVSRRFPDKFTTTVIANEVGHAVNVTTQGAC